MKHSYLLLPLLLLFAPVPVGAWRTVKTEHFTVFYAKGDRERAVWLLGDLERARPAIEKLAGHTIRHYPVVIQDMGSLVNSLTDPVNGVIQIFPDAPSSREDASSGDWLLALSTHEYTHALNLTAAGGLPWLLKTLGGTSVNLNLANPEWAIEGIAVFEESSYSPHAGRLNDGLFKAVAEQRAREGKAFGLLESTFLPWEYPLGVHYIAGGLFHGYLARTYGPEAISEFYRNHDSSFWQWASPVFPALGMDEAARKAFGKGIPSLWKDWQGSLLAAPAPGDASRRLTKIGWNLDALQSGDGRLYVEHEERVKTAVRSGFTYERVLEVDPDTGKKRTVVSTTAPFAGPLRLHGRKMYYATQEVRDGYPNTTGWGYESRLYVKDLDSGKTRFLFQGPFRAYEAMPDGSILTSRDRAWPFGGVLELHLPNGKVLLMGETDLMVDEILTDGRHWVATAKSRQGSFGLYVLDPYTGALAPLLDTPWLERAEAFDGNRLLFTANYGGAYGAYSLDLESHKVTRLSDAPYAASPAPLKDGGTAFIGLRAGGNDLYRTDPSGVAFELPDEKETAAPGDDPLAGMTVKEGGYGDNLSRLVPKILHVPFYFYGDGEDSIGGALAGGDAVYDIPLYTAAYGWDRARDRGMGAAFLVNRYFAAQYLDAFGDRNASLFAYDPLHLSLSPGCSALWVGASGNLWDDGRRRQAGPWTQLGFQGPGWNGNLGLQAAVERRDWGSSVERRGVFADVSVTRAHGPSQLQAYGKWISDPDNPDSPFGTPRGYGGSLQGKRGAQANLTWTWPFLRIRRGLWNPSLYAEDLDLVLFGDGAWEFHGASQVSYGAELHLEASATTAALPLDLGFRYARTRENEWETSIQLGFNLPFFMRPFSERNPAIRPPDFLQGIPGKASPNTSAPPWVQ